MGTNDLALRFGWSASGQRRVVYALLGLFVGGFCAFWPNALLVTDETQYVGQALLFSRGETTREVRHVLDGTRSREPAGRYPVGSSALQAPFVRLGGWRLAPVPSLLAIVATVLVLLKWLSELRRPPIFAVLPLVFIGTLVQGRLCMSDAMTALISTLAFWLFSRGERESRWAWLGAGFFAGLSAAFRDATPLLFVPLFAGTIVRRDAKAWQLVLGGIAGLSVRFITARLLFGSALYLHAARPNGASLALSAIPPNLVLYGFILVFAIPLGLPSLFMQRSWRKLELLLGAFLLMAVYLLFPLPHDANGAIRDVVLHARYCTAFLPLMAFSLAEWIPRLVAGSERIQRWLVFGVAATASVLIMTVHIYLHAWGTTLQRMTSIIYSRTPEGSVLVTNPTGTGKFMSEAFGSRDVIQRELATPKSVAQFVSKTEPVYVVFVDRTDAEFRRLDAADNTAFLAGLQASCQVDMIYDAQESAIERLRIARVPFCNVDP